MAEQALPKVVKEGDFTDPLTASPSPPPPPVTAGGGGVQGERETSPTQRSATDPGLIASGPEEEKGEGEEDEEPFTELEIDLGGPVIITNGLKLTIAKQQHPVAMFDYALTPFMEESVPIPVKVLVTEAVEGQHIRCHELQQGQSLLELISSCQNSDAKGLILVNNEDTHVLNSEFLVGAKDKGRFPVLLLSKGDGAAMMKVFDRYENDEVLAKVDAESGVDAGRPREGSLGRTQHSVKAAGGDPGKEGTGVTSRLLKAFGLDRKASIDLKSEMKKLIFSGAEAAVLSEDVTKFCFAMAVFGNYEKIAKSEATHSDVSDVLSKFMKHLGAAFPSDFPFYLLLAYRMHIKTALYQCDELGQFIRLCIELMERLTLPFLAQTFNAFIKRGDFNIMSLLPDKATSGVFELLENACLELSQISYQVGRRTSATSSQRLQLYPGFLHGRMMWISLALRLHSERGMVTRSVRNMWTDKLLTYQPYLVLDPPTCKEIKAQLEFGGLIHLLPELTFGPSHLLQLLASDKCCRPFEHVKHFINTIENYLLEENDFYHFVVTLRSVYTSWLKQEGPAKLKAISLQGTLAGALEEGVSFLNELHDIWGHRSFSAEMFDSECVHWLKLLLQLVDLTKDDPQLHLKRFITGRSKVCSTYRKDIINYVVAETEKKFDRLSVQQFYPLLKAFRIWSKKFIESYLRAYRVPQGIRIRDATWSVFINELVSRFPYHPYLLTFLKSIAEHYRIEKRAHEFIMDLLQLNVPKLFAVEPGELEEDAQAVAMEFTSFLYDFINRNALKPAILTQLTSIMTSISQKRNEFQQLVLSVVQREIIPESKALQGTQTITNNSLHSALQLTVPHLRGDLSWLQDLSTKQRFCWGLVAACCAKIPVAQDHFDWVHSYSYVIGQLGYLFTTYCTARKLGDEEKILSKAFPREIARSRSDDIRKYFDWVKRIQDVLIFWQEKFLSQNVNYDELLLYASSNIPLATLGNTLSSPFLVIDSQDVQQLKNAILQDFEIANVLLLKYIPGQPDAKWCTLPSLLADYGVCLPLKIAELLSKHVLFPGEAKQIVGELLEIPLPAATTGTFQPGHEVSITLTKVVCLHTLSAVVKNLQTFLQPLMEDLDMLVFFKLLRSVMFDKYLRLQIKKLSAQAGTPTSSSSATSTASLSVFGFSFPVYSVTKSGVDEQAKLPIEGLPLQVLVKSLSRTKKLIFEIMNGKAKYFEIIAEGELDLETLDIEREFATLASFSTQADRTGLNGVRSLLELFQYTIHIQNITDVCGQYHLDCCLQDADLKELNFLVAELKSYESRSNLTPLVATAKMKRVRELLCLAEAKSSKCLDLFAAIRNSAAFYQFVRDKSFVGAKGQARFRQLHQLITAQLQHEEYDETVLNHLYAAFRFIGPFMDTTQNLRTLMMQVTALDATDGIKQLETVNTNITLIRLWFSRAEGDTLENVAQDLDCITRTGFYLFHLTEDTGEGEAEIFLEYSPSSSGQQPFSFPSQPSSLEDPEARPITAAQLSEARSGSEDFTGVPRVPKAERWNSEQINDFVRKLGFLDTETKQGEAIKNFLHINEIAYKLLEVYMRLRELGHPGFLQGVLTESLSCTVEQYEADRRVKTTEQQLTRWTQQVAALRSHYDWLLFFSVPKLLTLYKLLAVDDVFHNLDAIVHEISFLSHNDEDTRAAVRAHVEKSLPSCMEDIAGGATPMKAVGRFLGLLFNNHTLPHRCGSTSQLRRGSMPTHSIFIDATQELHICHGFTQGQLMQVIVGIYDGVPESFEVFHCSPCSTEEELKLFLSRTGKHPLKFLVLQVNRLPYKLQEYLMQLKLMVNKRQEAEAGGGGSPLLSSPSPLSPCIHFIETAPSMLREIPGILQREHKEPPISFDQARKKCLKKIPMPHDLVCIQLVYGHAGDGKTHYIKSQLASSQASLTIAVNEAFTPLSAIKKLRSLPLTLKDCAIFFNFTMLPPTGVSVDDKWYAQYMKLMEVTGWFFFDLLLLGYVEDRETGLSFRIPGGLQWAIYVEVPSRDRNKSPGDTLKLFKEEVPALALLGTQHLISPNTPYSVDDDVKLVCKYLKALKIGGLKGIDRLFREVWLVKFSQDTISEDECHALLLEYMPEHICRSKITQRLFIKYMKRRCAFLDNLPSFNYNTGAGEYVKNEHGSMVTTDTKHLGSTLMTTMLNEVSDFCDPAIKENWSLKPHQQLIYDFKDGGASLGLITLHPEKLPEADKAKFSRIGVKIPSMTDLYDRKLLDGYLSRALNVELENGHLTPIDDSAYVLTIDYTIKMLNIHERYECGVPVIIEGETGVGKTALVEMLSKLWNHSLLLSWKKHTNRLLEFFQKKLGDIPTEISDNYPACVQSVEAMSSGEHVKEEDLLILCQLPDGRYGRLYKQLKDYLQPMQHDPVLALLTLGGGGGGGGGGNGRSKKHPSFEALFTLAQIEDTPEATASLLYAVLTAQIVPTFHKINVHAAMTPGDIASLFKPVFEQAHSLQQRFDKQTQLQRQTSTGGKDTSLRVPFVTVFLDEVNTSSCLGLFKEIIVDRTFDGEAIPDNMFIVAACNPHRGNSMATLAGRGEKEAWMRGTYYVRSLHPTLHFLMWDYGSLSTHQERDYINAKMKMLNRQMPNAEVGSLTDLIVVCQNLMRQYARKHLTHCSVPEKDAEISSRSCVSQRDIQRVFTLYQWFTSTYSKLTPYGNRSDYCRRAVLVSLGIVYYMRLNNNFRKEFSAYLDKENRLPGEVSFTKALEEELNWYMNQVELPAGIAHTQALKENLFATIVCCVNHIPLIIVGAPGSSKTLSFNQAIANLKGQESKVNLFRDTDIFPSLDPHYYQCSRRTTSNEVETVFSRAVNRQRSHRKFKLPIFCVVFMDEAGLPEESHESLKVLHYHLDKQEVSFVAITNHVLDAAKTNRAISLYRPEASDDDLETLAKGCLCSKPTPELESDLNTIVKFCTPYSKLMNKAMYHKEFRRFFGLRDFIHFVNYLRRKRLQEGITPQLVMMALERNFNGSEQFFATICSEFLKMMGTEPDKVIQRGILEILEESLRDRPQQGSVELERDQFRDTKPEVRDQRSENEVRYKLIIDPSEDDSIVRLLFSFGILKRDMTRMFVCSDFPGDSQLQKINTIAAIRHSAIEGHTVVMSQTDDIHESFYDLFNQRFRMIDDPKEGTRYYTNIAIGAHLKPSRVHPNFQCVIVVKNSELKDTPAPFLNRFEKYFISHRSLLGTALASMPYCMRAVVENSKKKVQKFIDCISAGSSLYGFKPETLDSLLLSILPSFDHTYQPLGEPSIVDDSMSVRVYLMQEFLQALRHSAGFNIPPYPLDELTQDTEHIFALILNDPEFDGLMPGLDHNGAILSVTEAMNSLHALSAPQNEQHNLNPEVCMVIAVFQQWLVRYLCKRLMQLMTSEALILHRNKIPFSYLENYLVNHSHFSLKEFILANYSTLHASEKDFTSCPTKLLCFTRSSPLIHQLPNMHPSTVFNTQTVADGKRELQNLVFEDTDKLFACKLSGVLSQSFVQELLKGFARSDKTEVCLLVANMQETSKQVVNHIRIMIEEIEALYPNRKKLYVLLLHFPPAQFFEACYPSLFLKGWDHCYLDTIAHRAVRGVVDIQDWFWHCCFPNQALDGSLESDSLIQALKEILPQAVPILASRVYFGVKESRSFNRPMNGSQRSTALRELLFERGVGDVLCEKFRAYWKPSVMVEMLKRAAMFNKNSESTLNITDSIQTIFKANFFDFLVYMLSRMNENFNLDLLFDTDCTPAVHLLFIDILRVFPTPKLAQVSMLSANLPTPKPPTHPPCFPFFNLVYAAMESVVEQSRDETNVKVNILNEDRSIPAYDCVGQVVEMEVDRTSLLAMLHQTVIRKLQDTHKEHLMDPVVLAIKAMSQHGELWQRYFTEFNLHKLHLESPSDVTEGIAQQILYAYFGSLHQQEAAVRIVGLHAYVHVYHLDVAKLATILRPLDKIQKMHLSAKEKPHMLTSPLSVSPSRRLMSSVKQHSHPLGSPEHLAAFVINALFNTVIGCLYQQDSSHASMPKFTLWFKAYRDVLILPTLKQYIYHAIQSEGCSSDLELVEARLNLMHCTFLALQTSPQLDERTLLKGRIIFQTLFSRHFNEAMELKTECPRLADITAVAVEIISDSEFSPSLHRDNHHVRLIMEGLFAHFFSAERQSYHRDDVQWFLQLANEQGQWRSHSFEQLVVSGGLEEDLMSKMEKTFDAEHQRQASHKVEVPHGAISMSIFKLYLVRVLGVCDRSSDDDLNHCGPLLLYSRRPRFQVGRCLCVSPELGPPAPYIPIFYQECPPIEPGDNSKSQRMQQPLAHLYFLTVLEHLVSSQLRLAGLVRTANVIRRDFESQSSSLSEPEQVLMCIELQALVQVVAQKLAENLDPSNPHKMGEVQPIVDDINLLLSDDTMGGGKAQGHGMVVALHMLKLLKSTRRFSELMTTKYDSICRGIDCLKPLHDQLKAPAAVPKPHLFPFLIDGADWEMHSLYARVRRAMVGMHEGKVQLNDLVQIAGECIHSVRVSPVNPVHSILDSIVSGGKKKHEILMEKRLCFRMLVWLVAYYEFYDKKIESQLLCNVFGGTEMAPYLQEEGYIRLIQTFLFPPLMINKPESPNPLRDDEVVLELTPDGHHRPVRRSGPNDVDPLYQLFVPDHPEKQDQSDVDLRHSLANLVAVVLGCPSRSNHLWFHLFAAEELKGTYLTGFMYDSKIKPEGLLYDCGVELTAEGQLGRQDYKKHANRGTFTLHSLYFLLWANFGSFCISLLTQPEAEANLHGPIISEWLSVRHYCVSQLRTMWLHMRNNLGLSDEERSFLVMKLMWRFCELTFAPHDSLLSPQLVAMGTITMDSLRGVFHRRDELDGYEKMWHKLIYQHTLSQLKTKFTRYSQYWQNMKLLEDLKRLECHYPYFARELDFTHSVVGHVDPSQSSHLRGELRLLSHFATEWRRLQAGGALLPDLLEFYLWIHTSLAHLVTYEMATSLPIGRVVELASRRYKGDHLLSLYERVKVGYNSYVELIGGAIGVGACAAVRQGNKIYTIADDIPLLHFLSDLADEEEGNDWLFTVIEDIITGHNMFIEGLYSSLHAQQDSPLARFLSDEPAKIFPSEADQYNCIVGAFKSLHGINDFLQLIRSRYQPPQSSSPIGSSSGSQVSLSESILHVKLRPIFQMTQLEEDVVVAFIAGKPLISSAAPFRIPFKFRQSLRLHHQPSVADVVHSDMADVKSKLSLQFQVPLGDALRKRVEYEFHSAGYHTMVAVVTGLKTVVGHLVKSLELHVDGLEDRTVSQFMLALYELSRSSEVLAEIGIPTLTPSQVTCLSELPLPSLCACLEMFAAWVDEGLYDFSALPFPLKTHMSDGDRFAVENELRDKWTGSLAQLLEEVMQMNDVLKHSETHITKIINDASQKPIVEYLKDNHYFDDQDKLLDLIPQTILLQHYVSFRLALRRVVLKVRKEVEDEAAPEDGVSGAEQWREFVDSLWDEALPHLRPQVYDDDAFVFDPYTGKYGFQDDSEFDSDNELMDDLMNEPGFNEEEGGGGLEDSFAVVLDDAHVATGHSYDLAQPPSDEEDDEFEVDEHEKESAESAPPHQKDELEERFRHDSEFQKKVLSMAKTLQQGVVSLEQEARQYTPERVGEFLASNDMERYAQDFVNGDISGEILLEADNEVLTELGVTSAVDRLRIQVLFKRTLRTGLAKYPVAEVIHFLKENKLSKYTDAFELNGIDGDMILAAEDRFFNDVMQEIGVSSAVDRLKIRSKFKSYISGQ